MDAPACYHYISLPPNLDVKLKNGLATCSDRAIPYCYTILDWYECTSTSILEKP